MLFLKANPCFASGRSQIGLKSTSANKRKLRPSTLGVARDIFIGKIYFLKFLRLCKYEMSGGPRWVSFDWCVCEKLLHKIDFRGVVRGALVCDCEGFWPIYLVSTGGREEKNVIKIFFDLSFLKPISSIDLLALTLWAFGCQ